MNIVWNSGSAAERFRHNLRLKKNKKKKRAPSAKPQAPSLTVTEGSSRMNLERRNIWTLNN
jgi:hypothetical protein